MIKYNLTENQYLEIMLGPPLIPLDALVMILIVYTVLFTVGILGNMLTCIVLFRSSLCQITAKYLFSLSVSDMMVLILGKK